jgi:flagellin
VNFGDLATNNVTHTDDGLDAIVITGVLKTGDVISYKVTASDGTEQFATMEVGASDTLATSPTVTELTSAGGAATEMTSAGNTTSGSTHTLVITDVTGGLTVSKISDVAVSRGTHAPVAATDITSSTLANTALGVLDTAINGVNTTRAGLGASMSRLEYASDNLQNVAQNTASARSRVMDADYAAETTELARTQIIQQAGTAMLAQANQSQQAVLALLR